MSPLARALFRRHWPLVALYLLLGVTDAAASLAPLDRALLLCGIDRDGADC